MVGRSALYLGLGLSTRHTHTGELDYEFKLSRAKFEELNLKHFNRSMESVLRVLKDAGVSKDKVDEVVLIGGVRNPTQRNGTISGTARKGRETEEKAVITAFKRTARHGTAPPFHCLPVRASKFFCLSPPSLAVCPPVRPFVRLCCVCAASAVRLPSVCRPSAVRLPSVCRPSVLRLCCVCAASAVRLLDP
eukprot:SAG22_NODE_2669_length_2320_cov_1.458352_2_plen_191_part_00